jgi:hypothetical protein
MKEKLFDAMVRSGESTHFMQRVFDCLYGEGPQSDIEVDLREAKVAAADVVRLLSEVEDQVG